MDKKQILKKRFDKLEKHYIALLMKIDFDYKIDVVNFNTNDKSTL